MPAGRPSIYTEELVDTICNRLMSGESLRGICTDDDMPDRTTVVRWLGDKPDFAAKYARARESQSDLMDDLILEVANACTNETFQADRVKIGAYQWRASKLAPKKYGDRVTQEHTGKDGGPIETQELSSIEAARRIAFVLTRGERETNKP